MREGNNTILKRLKDAWNFNSEVFEPDYFTIFSDLSIYPKE
jgi:hypothetical protein